MSTRACRAFTAVGCFFLVALTGAPAMAQVNTTSVRGKVLGTDSAPVAAAKVTLTHEPSGVKLSRVTDKGGAFSFSTRRVGGPYRVEVEAGGYDTRVIRDLFLRLGRTKTLQVKMDLVEVERLVVQGRSVTKRVSSAKKYGREDVQRLPSVSRDPKDIVRLTPEAVVDGDDDQLSIGGVNSRFNSVTIDGIRQDDDFGLNNSGYPTRRSPISIAAIEEIAVEISPFDVEYQGFLGGNVNIVTKSGTNEFQGSLFTNYTSDTFTGSRSRADAFELDFEEFTYGATFSGPIIEDKLHFFVGVDGLLATSPNEVGPAGSGAPNQISEVTEADVARAQQISRDVYGFDAGTAGQSLDEDDLKLIAKIDWAIDDSHHLVANFQQTIGSTIEPRGSFFNNLGLTSNWYEKQDNLTTASAKLRSDWTYDLSTEVELSTKFVDTIQRPLTGRDFMQAEIGTPGGGFLRLGPDEFRHANRLENNLFFAKGRAEYLWRDHLFSAGVEYERLDVFNLFVPGSRGVAEYDTLDAFAAQTPTALLYNNSVTNNARDAAAEWWFSRISTYVQDELELTPELSVQAGLRFETFQASRDIDFNQNFQNRHGFSNTETLNGRGVMLPRAAITYAPVEWINVRGGFGLFSGGTPNVWVSNTYGNTGISIDETFETDPAILAGFDGRNIPAAVQQQLVPGDGNVDALDPDFEIPSSWKASVGADVELDFPEVIEDVRLSFNYVYTRVNQAIRWVDLRRDLESIPNNLPVGTLPDGRPFYDVDNFDTRRGYDLLLTNTDQGDGHSASINVSRRWKTGLFLSFGYAYQRVREVSPATSSQSSSNYGNAAVIDPNNPELGPGLYQRPHRLIVNGTYAMELIEGLETTISAVWESRSGQPFSYTFGGQRDDLAALFGESRDFSRRQRALLYVPSGDGSDVIFNGVDEAAFNQWLVDNGLDKFRGQIAPKNAFRSAWIHQMDVRFQQELPSPGDHELLFILDIENFGNIINPDWGRDKRVPFPFVVSPIDVSIDQASGRYVYSNLDIQDTRRVSPVRSVWKLQAGLMYNF